MTVYIENDKKYMKKLLKLINEFGRVTVQSQQAKSNVFLCTRIEESETTILNMCAHINIYVHYIVYRM